MILGFTNRSTYRLILQEAGSTIVGLIIAVAVFAAVLIIALILAAVHQSINQSLQVCLYKRSQGTDQVHDSYSSPSPPSAQQLAYANRSLDRHRLTTTVVDAAKDHDTSSAETSVTHKVPYFSTTVTRQAFTTDDLDNVKDGSYYSQAQYIWQNGRRTSSNTAPVNIDHQQKLYY